MKILAIDPGTMTAYAEGVWTEGGWPSSIGSVDLGDRTDLPVEARWTHRVVTFRSWLIKATARQPDVIAYENGFHRGKASEFFAGLRWQLRLRCFTNSTPYVLVTPTTLKKYATGNGRAKKYQMHDAALEKWGDLCGLTHSDHDAIDALWLWDFIGSESEFSG